ncbi:MAG: hypothetical protein KDB23_24800, partial [Planctomycetales bacterium]|nr:hypothetical protein [Planctomycetales bacterium]
MNRDLQKSEIIVPRGGLRGARLPLIFLLPMAFLTFWVVRAHLNGEVPPEDGIGLPLLLGGISGVLAIASLDAAVRWGRIAVADGALQVTEHRLAWTRRLDFPIDEVVEVCAQMEDNGDIQRCRLCVKTLADERIVFAELPRQVVEQLAHEANRLCQAATASGECAQSPSVTVSWVQFMQGMFVVAATFALVVAISHFMSRIYTLEFVRDSTSRVRLAAEHRILLVPAGTMTIEHPYIVGEPQLVDDRERRVGFRGEQGAGDFVMSDSQLAKVQAFLSSDESGRLRFTVGNPLAELAAWIFASATGFMLVCVLGSIPSLTNRRRNR